MAFIKLFRIIIIPINFINSANKNILFKNNIQHLNITKHLKLFRFTIFQFTYELYDSLEGGRDFRPRSSRCSLESCIFLLASCLPLLLPFLERLAILPISGHPLFDIVSKTRNTASQLAPPSVQQPCCSLLSRYLNSLAREALHSNKLH